MNRIDLAKQHVWYHKKCGSRLRIISSRPSGIKPMYGGYCPKCHTAVSLPDDDK